LSIKITFSFKEVIQWSNLLGVLRNSPPILLVMINNFIFASKSFLHHLLQNIVGVFAQSKAKALAPELVRMAA